MECFFATGFVHAMVPIYGEMETVKVVNFLLENRRYVRYEHKILVILGRLKSSDGLMGISCETTELRACQWRFKFRFKIEA